MIATTKQSFFIALVFILISSTLSQVNITNVPFECRGRLDGFWRDSRYCDVFHACVAGQQKASYGCPQVGERFYFDDTSQRCEFASQNAGGCQGNQYYTSVTNGTAVSGSQLSTQAPSEPWKIFIQSREQFSCASRQNGFYASRWCNVFYRCEGGVSNAFLCPLQRGGGRLWWVQHGQSQVVPEASAECTYPCATGRPCSSAGGIIVENGNQISESQQEADTVYRQSVCTNQGSQTGTGTGGTQTGSGQQSQIGSGTGQQTGINTGIGTGQTGSGQQGSSQGGGSNPGQTGGGSQGGSSSTGGLLNINSDANCNGQPDGAFLPSPYCNVFHRCVSGTRFDFRCARALNVSYDLWWNQETSRCDWPCRIQCNKQLYESSSSAQQVQGESLIFFNNNCGAYPLIFNKNK